VIVDAVPGQLGGDRAAPDGGQLVVVGSGPQRGAQVALVPGEQVVADLAVGVSRTRSQAAQNGRVTEPITPSVCGPLSTRKVSAGADPPAGWIGGGEREPGGQGGQDLAGGDHAGPPPAVLGIQRHLLDEPELVSAVQA
jgi:hypothetical protein